MWKNQFIKKKKNKKQKFLFQSVDKLPILKKIDFLINQSGLNCLKRANIRYLIPKKCSFLYFSVRNIKGCDKADLKNRLCQQPEIRNKNSYFFNDFYQFYFYHITYFFDLILNKVD